MFIALGLRTLPLRTLKQPNQLLKRYITAKANALNKLIAEHPPLKEYIPPSTTTEKLKLVIHNLVQKGIQ